VLLIVNKQTKRVCVYECVFKSVAVLPSWQGLKTTLLTPTIRDWRSQIVAIQGKQCDSTYNQKNKNQQHQNYEQK